MSNQGPNLLIPPILVVVPLVMACSFFYTRFFVQSRKLTAPTCHFFSLSALVNRRLSIEYFKHLPGILSGVGIVGTFSGLLFGWSNFDAAVIEEYLATQVEHSTKTSNQARMMKEEMIKAKVLVVRQLESVQSQQMGNRLPHSVRQSDVIRSSEIA